MLAAVALRVDNASNGAIPDVAFGTVCVARLPDRDLVQRARRGHRAMAGVHGGDRAASH